MLKICTRIQAAIIWPLWRHDRGYERYATDVIQVYDNAACAFYLLAFRMQGIGFRYAEQRPIRSNEEIVNEILEANGMLSTQEIKAAIEAQGGGIGINQLEKLLHIRFKRVKEGRKS